MQAAIMQ